MREFISGVTSSEKCVPYISWRITCDNIHNMKKTQEGLIKGSDNVNNSFSRLFHVIYLQGVYYNMYITRQQTRANVVSMAMECAITKDKYTRASS